MSDVTSHDTISAQALAALGEQGQALEVSGCSPDPFSSARDWLEDARHENGNYWCQCCNCGGMFIGHKRRIICKVCAFLPNDPAHSTTASDPTTDKKP